MLPLARNTLLLPSTRYCSRLMDAWVWMSLAGSHSHSVWNSASHPVLRQQEEKVMAQKLMHTHWLRKLFQARMSAVWSVWAPEIKLQQYWLETSQLFPALAEAGTFMVPPSLELLVHAGPGHGHERLEWGAHQAVSSCSYHLHDHVQGFFIPRFCLIPAKFYHVYHRNISWNF